MKLLFWDGTGVCLFAKRLEEGAFRWPSLQDGVMRLSAAQLAALLEGLDWSNPVMALAVDTLPDDPATLETMLLAERTAVERLRLIIKQFQRHRFGRRAERLDEDRLHLGLEEIEQAEAEASARAEDPAPTERAKRAASSRSTVMPAAMRSPSAG